MQLIYVADMAYSWELIKVNGTLFFVSATKTVVSEIYVESLVSLSVNEITDLKFSGVFLCSARDIFANSIKQFQIQSVNWYSVYLPRRDGRLSWPRLLAMHWPGVELTISQSQVQRPNICEN